MEAKVGLCNIISNPLQSNNYNSFNFIDIMFEYMNVNSFIALTLFYFIVLLCIRKWDFVGALKHA